MPSWTVHEPPVEQDTFGTLNRPSPSSYVPASLYRTRISIPDLIDGPNQYLAVSPNHQLAVDRLAFGHPPSSTPIPLHSLLPFYERPLPYDHSPVKSEVKKKELVDSGLLNLQSTNTSTLPILRHISSDSSAFTIHYQGRCTLPNDNFLANHSLSASQSDMNSSSRSLQMIFDETEEPRKERCELNFRFFCDVEGCHAAFEHRGHLERHMRKHTQEKPFVCPLPICSRRFSRRKFKDRFNHSDISF